MNNYKAIWESINSESQCKSGRTQIARKILSDGIYTVFLATDFAHQRRLLYIRLGAKHKPILERLPRFRGLEVSIVAINLGEFTSTEFLKLEQSIPHTENIFESVIADVCERIIRISNEGALQNELINVLTEWKIFFEKDETRILPIAAQKGLISELMFLKDFLFPKFGYAASLICWTGASDRTNHDFQIGQNAVEIKSTTSKQHKKFVVSSEKQLDGTGLVHLYLSIYTLNVHANMPQGTLPAMIAQIETLIEDDPIASFLFTVKLAKSGYGAKHANQYVVGFSIGEIKSYEVEGDFPRLLAVNLPNGVGDIKYSVMTAACQPFQLQTDILNLL